MELPVIGPLFLTKVPGFQLIQGTWRFYIDIVLFGAILIGVATSDSMIRVSWNVIGIWTFAAFPPILLIVFNIHFYPHHPLHFLEPPEYIPVHTMSGSEQLDSILRNHTSDSSLSVPSLELGERLVRITTLPYLEKYDINLKSSKNAVLHHLYWPAWHLYVNGKEITTRPDTIGRATATLPGGHYTLQYELERTPLEVAGLWISGVSWIGILISSGISLVRKRVKKND